MLKLKIDSLVGWRFSDVVQASWAGPGWSQWTGSDGAGVSHGSESGVPRGFSGPSLAPPENSQSGRVRESPARVQESLATSPPLTGSRLLWGDGTSPEEGSRPSF